MRFKHVSNDPASTRQTVARLDLNLLVLFDAVQRHRNLTAAGVELGLSQPAVSRGIGRLRQAYGEALFVRQQRGVQPTPLAEQLAPVVAQALALLRSTVERPGFVPAQSQRVFRLALSDIAERFFLPRLALLLSTRAPGVRLESVSFGSAELAERLGAGAADLALGYLPRLGKQVRLQRLFRERFVYVAREGHPALRGTPAGQALRQWPHVLVDPPGTQHAATVLALLQRLGAQDAVRLRVRSFLCVAPILEHSDLLAVLPSNLATLVSQNTRLTLGAPPRPIGSFDVSMAWHQRFHRDAALEWLRSQVQELFSGGVVAAPSGSGAQPA
jgi:DNA-binding transcriptional LysR family regulator